jgi:hypothetical protein
MYADDINILIMDKDVYALQRKTEKVIYDLEWWINRNDLIINVKKWNYVIPQQTSEGSNKTPGYSERFASGICS